MSPRVRRAQFGGNGWDTFTVHDGHFYWATLEATAPGLDPAATWLALTKPRLPIR